jgi:hypothetical protein
MFYSLEHPNSPEISLDSLKALRSSDEEWEVVKKESTAAEFVTVDIIYEIYTRRDDVINKRKSDLELLADILKKQMPLPGLDSNDINWKILHAAWLTIQVHPFACSA